MVEKVASGNALKVDPELKGLLEKLEFVKTYRTFKRWRSSFLTKYESFLEQEGIDNADKAYKEFSVGMGKFVKQVTKVEQFVEKGELTVDKYTVKARMCLGEMSKLLSLTIEEEEALIPQSGMLEKKRGYNKFHMGAVLVRDGFEEYGRLAMCGDVLKHMREVSLNEVADKQILEGMDNYRAKLQKFCDVMADLGLYDVMLKCREFANGEGDLNDLIFMDLKTGGVGEVCRADCLHKRLITSTSTDKDGNDVFSEAATDDEAKERILTMVNESNKLGIGCGNKNNAYEDEEVDLDAEKIKNMWGVTLKKTPKNEKGAEFIFVCQKTGAFGELSRRSFVEKGLITEVKDENDKDILGEAEAEFEERAALVETIRGLLNLGIAKEEK